jgi:hypothetical protein
MAEYGSTIAGGWTSSTGEEGYLNTGFRIAIGTEFHW